MTQFPFFARLLLGLILSGAAVAETRPVIRVGALAFGTLNWELAVIRTQGLDQANGVTLESTELASPEAGRIGLQGHSLDVVVSDWIWVAQQREQGHDYAFAPFSSSHGALMVAGDAPVHSLADLKGKRLGVAGGGLDKNWLLLTALAQQQERLDLARAASVSFGAPPLLSQALQQGQLDAVLTYWNFAAKLETRGYRQLMDGRQLQKALGIEEEVPSLGYVFSRSWAQTHPAAIVGFLKATAEARQRLCESEDTWHSVIALTQETEPATLASLRRHYCEGRVTRDMGPKEQTAAQRLFDLIQMAQGAKPRPLPSDLFWKSTP